MGKNTVTAHFRCNLEEMPSIAVDDAGVTNIMVANFEGPDDRY